MIIFKKEENRISLLPKSNVSGVTVIGVVGDSIASRPSVSSSFTKESLTNSHKLINVSTGIKKQRLMFPTKAFHNRLCQRSVGILTADCSCF